MTVTTRSAMLLSLFLAAQANAQAWSAQRVLSVGENSGVSFGQIAGIAAAPDGRFFVLDRMESRVHVFNAAGKLEKSFGKRGAGPGELSNLAMEILFTRGQLAVIDAMNQRISLFGTDGVFVTSRPLMITQGMPTGWASAGERLIYLARPMPGPMAAQLGGISKHTIFAVNPRNTDPADTLLRIDLPPDNEMSMTGSAIKMKMNMRVPQLALAGDGISRVLLATSDTYRIRVLAADGKTTGYLTRTVNRHRYTNDELARMKKQADSTMNAAFSTGAAAAAAGRGMPRPEVEFVMPEFAPVISGMIAGERFLLVSRNIDFNRRTQNDWDVLAWDGKMLGTLKLPISFTPRALSGDRLYGIEKDDLDVEAVAVYRIGPR
jgi:hypothetical protein